MTNELKSLTTAEVAGNRHLSYFGYGNDSRVWCDLGSGRSCDDALRAYQDGRSAGSALPSPVRERWVSGRTAVINQIRGLLLERGISIRKGRCHIEDSLPGILEDADNKLSGALRVLLAPAPSS